MSKQKNGFQHQGKEIRILRLDEQFYNIASKDYDRFMNEVRLATTYRQKQLLAAQSVHGHAMNGDKEFTQIKKGQKLHYQYPNSTIEDVYEAIIKSNKDYAESVEAVKEERTEIIQEVKGWVRETLDNLTTGQRYRKYRGERLIDSKGNPLMGLDLFKHVSIKNPISVLQGLYLGSYMDSEYWREQTEDYFKTAHGIDMRMHRGLCTAGNLEEIMKAGMTLSDMAYLGKEERGVDIRGIAGAFTLDELKEKGMVFDFKNKGKEGIPNKKPWVPVYVEIQKGYGSSDDAAFNFVGLRYGIEAGYGLIIVDGGDTIDKCLTTIQEKGADELIGDYIHERLGGKEGVEKVLGLTEQDIINTIFAAAIDKDKPYMWPSCSQRRFLEVNERGDYALVSHIDHIKHICEGTYFPTNIKLSIKEISSDLFYNAFKKKIRFMMKNGLVDPEDFRYKRSLEYFLGNKKKKRHQFIEEE